LGLVTHDDRTKDVEQWSQAIMVAERRHHEHAED
jgi:hypothetical protein